MCPLSVVLFMSSLTFQMPSTAYVVVRSPQRALFLFSLHFNPLLLESVRRKNLGTLLLWGVGGFYRGS